MVQQKFKQLQRDFKGFIQLMNKKSFRLASNTDSESYQRSMVELEEQTYQELKQAASRQQTTITAIVHEAIEHYLSSHRPKMEKRLSAEHKDRNPLLLLDGIGLTRDLNNRTEKKQERNQEVDAHDSREQA